MAAKNTGYDACTSATNHTVDRGTEGVNRTLATLDEASFKDKNQAAAFRTDWNGQGDFVAAASKAGGTVSERGQVSPAPDQTTGEVPPLTAAAFALGRGFALGGLLRLDLAGDRGVLRRDPALEDRRHRRHQDRVGLLAG